MTGTAGIVSPTAPPDPLQWLVCSSVSYRVRLPRSVAARAVAAGDTFQVLSILSEPYLLALLASFTGSFSTLQDLAGRLDMLRYGQQLYVSRQIEAFLEREAVAGLG